MPLGIGTVGAYVNGTGNLTPGLPNSESNVNDLMMICSVGTKPFNGVNTMNNAWQSVGFATDGTVAAGTDVGSMKAEMFYKIRARSGETAPTVTNVSNNVSGAVIAQFTKDQSKNWEVIGSGGGDNTANTTYSTTTVSALDLRPGDFLVAMIALRSDASTIGTVTITGSGLTISAFTKLPETDLSTTAGGDMRMSNGYCLITAGTNVTTLTISSTLSGSQTGSSFIVRLREVDPPAGGNYYDPFGMMGIFGI